MPSKFAGRKNIHIFLNTVLGSGAGQANTTGSSNTAVGNSSLSSNTTGGNNVAIGQNAGLANTTGNNKTFVGNQANASANNLTNSTALGNGASVATANTIVLGNSSIITLRCNATLSNLSDKRDKKDITPLEAGINFIEKLQPVNFKWNMRDGGKIDIPETGFIAQDLQQVQKETNTVIPNLVDDRDSEKIYASYGTLLPVMVKAIQDLNNKIKDLEKKVNF